MSSKEQNIKTFQRQNFGQDHGTRGTDHFSCSEGYTETARLKKESLREGVSVSGQTDLFDSTGLSALAESPQLVMSTESDGYPLYPAPQQGDEKNVYEIEGMYDEFSAILSRHNVSTEDRVTAAMVFAKSPAVRAMVQDVVQTPSQPVRLGFIARPRR